MREKKGVREKKGEGEGRTESAIQKLDKGTEVEDVSLQLASPSQDSTDDLESGGQYGTVRLGLRACQLIHVLNSIVILLLTLAERVGGERNRQGARQTKLDSLKTVTGNTI